MSDYLRRVEAAMTPKQMRAALDSVSAGGWKPGTALPLWMWHLVFQQAAPEVCRRVSDDIVIERAPDLFRRIDAALAKKRPAIW